MSMYISGLYVASPAWWDTAPDIKALLLDAAGTYAFDESHEVVSDLVPGSNELVTTGYTRQAVSLSAATWDVGTELWQFPASSLAWPALGPGVADPTVGGVVFFEDTGFDSLSRLIRHEPLSVLLDGTTFTVFVAPSGLLTVAEAP